MLFELGRSRRETRDIVYRAMRTAMLAPAAMTDTELLELINERQHLAIYKKRMMQEISALIVSI